MMRNARIGALLLLGTVLAPAATHAQPALSPKLQAARKTREVAVAAAKLKMNALIENAKKNGGKATGPAARWIKSTFRREPTTSFLLHLNHTLTVGLLDATNWVEKPESRPPCSRAKTAVAQQGGDTIWLCDGFYTDSNEESALTLFHEAQHLHGVGHCQGGPFSATPDELLCADSYEWLLKYLWKETP